MSSDQPGRVLPPEPFPDEWLSCPRCSKNGLDREDDNFVCTRCGWSEPIEDARTLSEQQTDDPAAL